MKPIENKEKTLEELLKEKKEADRNNCLTEIKKSLEKYNCDIDSQCLITNTNIRVVWGVKNKS